MNGAHFPQASAIAQNTHTTLARPLLNFEKNNSFSFILALKIRVSLVRFQSRPPNKTAVFAREQRFFSFRGHRFWMFIRTLKTLFTD